MKDSTRALYCNNSYLVIDNRTQHTEKNKTYIFFNHPLGVITHVQ